MVTRTHKGIQDPYLDLLLPSSLELSDRFMKLSALSAFVTERQETAADKDSYGDIHTSLIITEGIRREVSIKRQQDHYY